MTVAVIGVPYTSTGQTTGEALAPAKLRAAGLLPALRRSVAVVDTGDIDAGISTIDRDPVSGVIAPHALIHTIEGVRGAVDRALRGGLTPFVVGGECPLLLGCLAAARDHFGRVGLLFLDGHEDAWPPMASTTGEAADMELGLALGLTSVPGIPGLHAPLPLVRLDDAIILGPRDQEEIAAAGIPSIAPFVTMLDDASLRATDLRATATSMTRRLHEDAGQWWFHLDLDVLATDALPAVRYPQPGGLSWEQLADIARVAMASPGLIGWNITIYNPDLDPDHRSAAQIVAFLAELTAHLP